MAGFAIRSRFAGHPSCSAKTRNALRLKPDHPIGAGQDPTPSVRTGILGFTSCPFDQHLHQADTFAASAPKLYTVSKRLADNWHAT